MLHALVLVAVIASAQCGDRQRGTGARMAEPDTVRLTAASPRQSVVAAAEAVQRAEILRFSVTNVTNPDRRAIAINAALHLDAVPVATIGDVALFPVDRGGTFSLRVPHAVRALMSRAQRTGRPPRLVFTLAPDAEATATDRRAVSVTAWQWVRTGS